MHAPLFAAGLDWLEGLLPVLFVLFWIVSQVVNVFRNVAGRGQPQRPQPMEQPRPPRPQPARLSREKPRPAPRPPRREPVVAETKKKPQPPRPPAAGIGSLGSHGGDIERHVRDAFADDLGHRPSRLAAPSAAPTMEPATARPAVPHDLVALLRDPAALRQLFIVREVLDRPVERWS